MLPFENKDPAKIPRELNTHHQQKSQQFYFGPQNIRHIGKRTGRILRPSDHNSTFLKFQASLDTEDYLIIAKQQLSSFSQIPRQIEPNSTQIQSSKQPDLSKMTQKEEQKIQQDFNVAVQKQKEESIEINAKQNINRNIEKESRKSVDRYFAVVENSPFAVPNISNVKHRYSGGGRKSEEFLLELLRSQKKSKDKNQPSQEVADKNKGQQVIKENKKKEQLVLHQQKKNQNKRKKSQIVHDVKQQEIKQKPKSKRVTINDRGKIKLPTDSFSLQFNIASTTQIRNNSNQNNINQIQQKEEEYQTEQQIHKKRQRSFQFKENQCQRSFQFKGNQKKQHTQQIQQQLKPKKSASNNRIARKTSKAKSSKSNKNKDVQNQLQKLTKRRKIEIGQRQQDIIAQVVQPAINPNTGRPVRQKRQPQQFHKNQKTLYNSKNEVVMTGISTELFLQILGFTVNFQIKNSSIKYGSNYMQHMFKLKPQQEISSIGIDEEKLNQYLKPLANFEKMWICPQRLGHRYLQIKIDNFVEQILDKQVYIEREQKVQVRNIMQNRSCNIIIGLERPANSKQKDY